MIFNPERPTQSGSGSSSNDVENRTLGREGGPSERDAYYHALGGDKYVAQMDRFRDWTERYLVDKATSITSESGNYDATKSFNIRVRNGDKYNLGSDIGLARSLPDALIKIVQFKFNEISDEGRGNLLGLIDLAIATITSDEPTDGIQLLAKTARKSLVVKPENNGLPTVKSMFEQTEERRFSDRWLPRTQNWWRQDENGTRPAAPHLNTLP